MNFSIVHNCLNINHHAEVKRKLDSSETDLTIRDHLVFLVLHGLLMTPLQSLRLSDTCNDIVS